MHPVKRATLLLILALMAYIIRSSLVWLLLPAAFYAVWIFWSQRPPLRQWLRSTAAVVFSFSLLVGPQIYISYQKFGSLNPYPTTSLLSTQIAVGISTLKFAFVEDAKHSRQLVYWSPFAGEPEEIKTIHFYFNHPVRGAFLALSHAFVGFHYDQIKPYWRLERARPLTIWLLLSSAIVFLGITRMATLVFSGGLDADSAFAIAVFGLCAASLMFITTESRFGIIGFAMLSIKCAEWFAARPSRAQWALLAPGLLMYLIVSFLYNTLLLQNADITI